MALSVCVLKRLGDGRYEAAVADAGVPFEVLGSRGLRDRAAFRRLRDRWRDAPPDVVHAHLTDAVIWGDRLARRLGVPLVTTQHVLPGTGGLAGWRGRLRSWLEGRALRRAAAVAAVSAPVRQAWIEQARLDPARVTVVPNGVDLDRFDPDRPDHAEVRATTRRRLGVPDGVPLVATVAVLREGKGLRDLAGAARRLLDGGEGPTHGAADARFAVAGDGPLADELRAATLPLGDRFQWLGAVDDPAPLLAAADLFVLPSRGDALPTVLMEAMAAGLPVVACDSGGVPALVADGDTGLLVPPGDAAALAGAVADLLRHPARRAALGAAGRRRATERFGLAAWVRRLDDLYARATANAEADAPDATAADHPPDAAPGAALPRRPLRVAVVEPAARGGMAHHAYQLCRGLVAAGAEPVLVTARHYELADRPHPFRRVELLRLWDPKPAGGGGGRRLLRRALRALVWYREWARLLLWLARHRPDVVQLGDVRFSGDLVPLALLARLGLPLVDVCHNVVPFGVGGRRAGSFAASRLTGFLYRRIYRRFDRVIVHFEANRRTFLAATGLPPRRVAAVPFGNQELFTELADPAVTPADLARRLDLPEDARVVLLFGTLAPYKGAEVLLPAFAEVAPRHPQARLVLAGFPLPGFDVPAVRALAAELGLGDGRGEEDRVRFVLDYLPAGEVAAWMGLASVVVLPYLQIYQSGVLQLAATFGRPLVASAVGALPEIVDDGRTGLLVPPGDPAALAAALGRLLADPGHAAALGSAAAEDARTRFAWERVARAYLQVHREAVAARRGGATTAVPKPPAEPAARTGPAREGEA